MKKSRSWNLQELWTKFKVGSSFNFWISFKKDAKCMFSNMTRKCCHGFRTISSIVQRNFFHQSNVYKLFRVWGIFGSIICNFLQKTLTIIFSTCLNLGQQNHPVLNIHASLYVIFWTPSWIALLRKKIKPQSSTVVLNFF